MSDNAVPTKELERQWRIATRPAPDDVTEEMAREVFEACDYLAEMSEALAAEVLALRKWETQAREALVECAEQAEAYMAGGYHNIGSVAHTARAALTPLKEARGEWPECQGCAVALAPDCVHAEGCEEARGE